MAENGLTIALPKGRLLAEGLSLLAQAGYETGDVDDTSRKLLFHLSGDLRVLLAKPLDIPTYVAYGAADLGFAGKDVLMEQQEALYELLDLGIGACRLCVAGPERGPYNSRVATKYPNIATGYFREHGEQVEIIHLNGSVELAPLVGLAGRILDVVSTGQTLRENHLVVLAEVAQVTTRLIANVSSYRVKAEAVDRLMERLENVVEERTKGVKTL